jgi:hypothetical protein
MKLIPIKMEKIDVSDIEELEYKYLEAIPQDIIDRYNEIKENFYNDELRKLGAFIDNRFDVVRYLAKIKETNLFIYRGFLWKSEPDCDFLLYERYSKDKWGMLITEELIKDVDGKEWDCNYHESVHVNRIYHEYKGIEISFDEFVNKFNEYKKEKTEEAELKLIEKEKEREEKLKGNEEERTKFDNGIWRENDKTNYGIGDTIHYDGKTYTFKEDINKLFKLEELNSPYNGYNRYGIEKLDWIEDICVENNISYKFLEKRRNYEVIFKDDKMYIDGVSIPKNKATFFISRANGIKENIEILKKLSAIKVEFLNLKSLEISTPSYIYNIPIDIKYTDDLFDITLMNKTIKKDWKDLEIFKYSTQSLRYCFGTGNLKDIMQLFDISKEDMFDFMKKIQMLDKLGEE